MFWRFLTCLFLNSTVAFTKPRKFASIKRKGGPTNVASGSKPPSCPFSCPKAMLVPCISVQRVVEGEGKQQWTVQCANKNLNFCRKCRRRIALYSRRYNLQICFVSLPGHKEGNHTKRHRTRTMKERVNKIVLNWRIAKPSLEGNMFNNSFLTISWPMPPC